MNSLLPSIYVRVCVFQVKYDKYCGKSLMRIKKNKKRKKRFTYYVLRFK